MNNLDNFSPILYFSHFCGIWNLADFLVNYDFYDSILVEMTYLDQNIWTFIPCARCKNQFFIARLAIIFLYFCPILRIQACWSAKKWANKLIHNALSVILFTVDNRLGGIPFRTVNRLKLNRWGKPHGLNHVVLYRKNWYFCCQYKMINLQGTPVGENVDGLRF